jgi:hypothetical protein
VEGMGGSEERNQGMEEIRSGSRVTSIGPCALQHGEADAPMDCAATWRSDAPMDFVHHVGCSRPLRHWRRPMSVLIQYWI